VVTRAGRTYELRRSAQTASIGIRRAFSLSAGPIDNGIDAFVDDRRWRIAASTESASITGHFAFGFGPGGEVGGIDLLFALDGATVEVGDLTGAVVLGDEVADLRWKAVLARKLESVLHVTAHNLGARAKR
jgi:hypothetical protein